MSFKRRDYEISLWTIDDFFLGILKPSGVENKGQIQSPKQKRNNDGTEEFTFSVPMYIHENGERIENPIWYNTKNGNMLANMRKVKICFNKNDPEAKRWFEYVIVNVKERHKGDELFCDVKCSGLAFHELGKQGYRITLSSDIFYDEDYKWFTEDGAKASTEPHATLQYWMKNVLPSVDEVDTMSPNLWYYDVQMNWSSYTSLARSAKKIYEEEYTSSWTPVQVAAEGKTYLTPAAVEAAKEKERMVDISESNKYNITQKLAETFGVFCRYDYLHDDSGYITGRRVIFYNNFMKESEGYIDFTYPYQTADVSREADSTDLVTKMFVRPADDDTAPAGMITIMDVEANKSKEDYIFNFDYLEKVGMFPQEYRDSLEDYEKFMHITNTTLMMQERELLLIDEQLPDLKANITTLTNAIVLDEERMSQSNDLLKKLDAVDKKVDGKVSVTAAKPVTAIMLDDPNNKGTYYIKITEHGVDYSSLKIYRTIKYAGKSDVERLPDEIVVSINNKMVLKTNLVKSGKPEYDEFGNLAKVTNIYTDSEVSQSKILYLTYDYRPDLYYDNIYNTWERRLDSDTADLASYKKQLAELEERRKQVQEAYDALLASKTAKINQLEREFGTLIREGYWQPENYTDYGDRYADKFSANQMYENVEGTTGLAKLIWDTTEQSVIEQHVTTYAMGVDEQPRQYYCLDLSEPATQAWVKEHVDELAVIYYDLPWKTNAELTAAKNKAGSTWQDPYKDFTYGQLLGIGASCQYNIITDGSDYWPVLILTGIKDTADLPSALNNETSKPQIGLLKTKTITETKENPETKQNEEVGINILTVDDGAKQVKLLKFSTAPKAVFPRIEIDSLLLKTSSDQLAVTYTVGGKIITLEEYTDYYIQVYGEKYYVTMRPHIFFRYGFGGTFAIRFSLSNANTAIYLDAMAVLKENAWPKVSYTVNPNIVDDKFYYTAYDNLNRIININDPELKFENVQGYISELQLDLDAWWNDKIAVQNYKTKFEDLFSSIVAQTEAMQKSAYTVGLSANLFTGTGGDSIAAGVMQNTLKRVDLNYAFDSGKLTISPEEGIWGTSDSGVVAFRGGGIFTATEKDASGNWVWNTGIVPQGINADLITTGQLDTNRIKVYAGDKVRFQLNGDGLFAYKAFLEDQQITSDGNDAKGIDAYNKLSVEQQARLVDGLDPAQYVVFNENGLFLTAKKEALVLNEKKTDYVNLTKDVNRVSIDWDGLTLRNYNNERTFFANASTGDLTLKGHLVAQSLTIGDTVLGADNSEDGKVTGLANYISSISSSVVTSSMNGAYMDIDPNNGNVKIYTASRPKNDDGTYDSTAVGNAIIMSHNGIYMGTTAPLNLEGNTVTLKGSTISLDANSSLQLSSSGNSISLSDSGLALVGKSISVTSGTIELKSGSNAINMSTTNGISITAETTKLELKPSNIQMRAGGTSGLVQIVGGNAQSTITIGNTIIGATGITCDNIEASNLNIFNTDNSHTTTKIYVQTVKPTESNVLWFKPSSTAQEDNDDSGGGTGGTSSSTTYNNSNPQATYKNETGNGSSTLTYTLTRSAGNQITAKNGNVVTVTGSCSCVLSEDWNNHAGSTATMTCTVSGGGASISTSHSFKIPSSVGNSVNIKNYLGTFSATADQIKKITNASEITLEIALTALGTGTKFRLSTNSSYITIEGAVIEEPDSTPTTSTSIKSYPCTVYYIK